MLRRILDIFALFCVLPFSFLFSFRVSLLCVDRMSYDLWTAFFFFFSLILNILDLDAWGVQTDMKQAPCCVPMLSLFI